MLDGAIGTLTRIATKATRELASLLDSTNEPVKLGAIRLVMDSLLKLREHAELAARIDALEARAR